MLTFSSSEASSGDFEIIIVPPHTADSSAEPATNRFFRSIVINGQIPEAPWKDLIAIPDPIPIIRPKGTRRGKIANQQAFSSDSF